MKKAELDKWLVRHSVNKSVLAKHLQSCDKNLYKR